MNSKCVLIFFITLSHSLSWNSSFCFDKKIKKKEEYTVQIRNDTNQKTLLYINGLETKNYYEFKIHPSEMIKISTRAPFVINSKSFSQSIVVNSFSNNSMLSLCLIPSKSIQFLDDQELYHIKIAQKTACIMNRCIPIPDLSSIVLAYFCYTIPHPNVFKPKNTTCFNQHFKNGFISEISSVK